MAFASLANNKKYLFLDLLKIISISAVLIFHFLYIVSLNESLRPTGFIGVSLFFIISGFSLAKRYGKVTKFSIKWFLKRYLRVSILYYLALVLIVILFSVQVYEGNVFGNLFAHFLFIDNFFRSYDYGIISSSWFVLPLIFFYLLFPFLNKLIKKNVKWFLAGFVITVLIRSYYPGSYTSMNPLFFLAEFCFGIVIAKKKKIWILAPAILMIFVNPVMILPFIIFYLFYVYSDKYFSPNIVIFLAAQTLPLFLFHEGLFKIILDKWYIYGLAKSWTIAVYIIACIAVVLLSNKIYSFLSKELSN